MTDRLRVAVAGAGYLGRFHALIYAAMPAVDLVAVADTDPAVAQSVADECGCAATANAAALVGEIDAVSIVVPTSAHVEVARPFIEAGVHVLMEKPVAPTLAEAVALVDAAESAGIVFQVGHLERFNPGVRSLAGRVQAPRFIEAHRMSPFTARATDVDVVTDLMIHDIDIVLSLVDSPLRSVSAIGLPVLTPHVDIANARLEFDNDAVANLTASRVSENRFRRIRVFGANRYEALNLVDQQIESLSAQPVAGEEWPQIRREAVTVEARKPLDVELEAFVESVRGGQPPLVDGRVALQAFEVAMRVKAEMKQ